MFKQLLTPVAGSLPLSFIVAALPVATVLVLLGVMRRPAWQASLAGLIVGLIIAIGVWSFRLTSRLILSPTASYSPSGRSCGSSSTRCFFTTSRSKSKRFDAFRAWVLNHLPNDRRVVLRGDRLLLRRAARGHCRFRYACRDHLILLLLILVWLFRAIEALVFTLIFNTAPVAFGALGVPVTTLARYRTARRNAWRHDRPPIAVHRALAAFLRHGTLRRGALAEGAVAGAGRRRRLLRARPVRRSNYIDYALTDVLASLGSLIVTLLFLQAWKPAPDPEFAVRGR